MNGFLRDTAELHKRAEILDYARDPIYVTDLHGVATYWNREAGRIYGWTSADAVGKVAHQLLKSRFPKPFEELLQEFMREGRWEGEVTHFRKDGSPVRTLARWTLLHSADGSPLARMVTNTDFAELKTVLDSLREVEEQARRKTAELEAILEAFPAAAFLAHDEECRKISGNRIGYEMLRLPFGVNASMSAALGERPMHFKVMRNGRELSVEELPIQKAARTGRAQRDQELTLLFEDGTSIDLLGNAHPLRNERGEVHGAVSTFTDITQRKRAEAEARERAAEFRLLADSIPQLCWMAEGEGSLFWFNRQWFEYTGTTLEQMRGWGWLDVTDPAVQPMVAGRWKQSIESGNPFEMTFPLRGADGRFRQFLTRVRPLKDDTGRVIRWFGTNTDVTGEREHAQALAQSEQRFRELAEAVPQLIWVADAEGNSVWCNHRFLEYTGMAQRESLGIHWREVIHPEDLKASAERWTRTLTQGENFLNECRLRRHDGAYRYFLSRAVPVHGANGEILQWIGSSTDIHDQKLAEEALRRAEKLAVAGRMAASMAHEINNPLAGATNLVYLLQRDKTIGAHSQGLLALAEQELKRVARIATQELRFHHQSSAPQWANLSEVMDSVVTSLMRKVHSSGSQIERDYQPVEKLYCWSEELRQVFANLLTNAMDAVQAGGRIRVRIRAGREWAGAGRRGIRVTIADNGSGIPLDLRRRIFEPFVTTKADTGTGLGLWVTQGIVDRHQGRIVLRSSTDSIHHGAVFSIFLPDGLAEVRLPARKNGRAGWVIGS